MCLFRKIGTDLVFDGWHQQSVDTVIDRRHDDILKIGLLIFQIRLMRQILDMIEVIRHGNGDDLFLFRSVDRHDAMIRNIGDLFRVLIVHLIDLLLIDRILL